MNGALRTTCRRYCERAQSHSDENQKPPQSLLLSPAEAGLFWTSASRRPRNGAPVGATLLFCGKNVKLTLRRSSATHGRSRAPIGSKKTEYRFGSEVRIDQAAGEGFEPPEPLSRPCGFQDRPVRPLRHPAFEPLSSPEPGFARRRLAAARFVGISFAGS